MDDIIQNYFKQFFDINGKLSYVEKRFDCECLGEQLSCYIDTEDSGQGTIQNDVQFGMWNSGYHSDKMPLWTRIKYVLRVLRSGQPYKDQVILNHKNAIELANFLLEYVKDIPPSVSVTEGSTRIKREDLEEGIKTMILK